MHRHTYTGRKLSRATGPRLALVRGQITSLVLYEQIETTLAKAKEIAPQFERLITRAKGGTLADARAVRAEIQGELAYQKLMRELLPALGDRKSGYTRVIKIGNRRGDNAPMAVVSVLVAKKPAKAKDNKTAAVADKVEATKSAPVKAKAEAKTKTKPKAKAAKS